jgi:hypothetical protein
MFEAYGRIMLIGFDNTGYDQFNDPSKGLAELRQLQYDPAKRAALTAELVPIAVQQGGWVAIGIWRWLYWDLEEEYLTSAADALDASARAITSEIGLRDPYNWMQFQETQRYRAVHGEDPPGRYSPLGPPQFS